MGDELKDFEMSTDGVFMDAVDAKEQETEQKAKDEPEVDDVDDEEVDDQEVDDTDDSEDEDDEQDDFDDDDDSEDEDEEDDEDSDDVDDKKKEKPKKYTATMADGSQVKLTGDAVVKLKVDGKFEKVSIEDLKESYNGKVKQDEQIRQKAESVKQADAKLSTIKAEDEKIRGGVAAMDEAITTGNFMEAITVIAEMKGEEPGPVIDKWVSGLTEFIEDFASKTPEERAKAAEDYKLKSEVKGLEAKKTKLLTETQKDEANKAINKACVDNGLTREELEPAFQTYANKNKKLVDAGEKAIDFNLTDVINLTKEFKVYDQIVDIAEGLDLELTQDDAHYLLKVIKADEQRRGKALSEKQYKKVIESYAQKEVKKLSRKVGGKPKTSPKSKKQKPKELKRVSQVWD